MGLGAHSIAMASSALIDTLKQQWEATHNTMQWGQYPSEPLIQWVARNFTDKDSRKAMTVLDVGCGAGANLWYLAEQGFNCTGIDIAENALDRCKDLLAKRGQQAQLIRASMTDLPFAPESFDIILDLGGSSSIPLAVVPEYMAQIHTILKPGGHFFASFVGAKTSLNTEQATTCDNDEEQSFFVANGTTVLANTPTVQVFNQGQLQQFLHAFNQVYFEENLRSTHNQTKWLQHFWIHARRSA
jgi:cyclopropane fatty-acyl-phospholipid synthase-like methyltransferase